MIEFQISTDPDQKFATIINNQRVTMRLRFNHVSKRWSLDVSVDDLPVILGRRITTSADLFAAFDGLGLGILFAASIVPGAEPDRVQLPNGNVKLFHTTQDEVDAVVDIA